jgi:hypothetical protein
LNGAISGRFKKVKKNGEFNENGNVIEGFMSLIH